MESDTLLPGTLVAGRYRIVRELGRGGMGAVYAVEHVHSGALCALEVMLDCAQIHADRAVRFRHEARAKDDASEDANEAQTRHRALRVMASEQRNVVNQLEQETRFARTSSRTTERVRNALVTSERELSSVDEEIRLLGLEDSLSTGERQARQDELKERLRRLASRLALMETALRDG